MPTAIRGQELLDELLAVYESLDGVFRDAFLFEVEALSKSKLLKDLLDEIADGDLSFGDPIDSRLSSLTIPQKKFDDLVRTAMSRGAKATQKAMGLQGQFNLTNPSVINVARNLAVELSTNLNASVQTTISDIIRDAVEGNITTIQAARKIRNHIGLLPQHSKAVDKYLDKMLADGVKKQVANKRAEEYAQRLLKYRSETIARTEVARAVGAGQTEYWKQMKSEGYLPPEARRVWITANDEKVCPICGPMDGVLADIDGFFDTGSGPVEYPQGTHPRCRCTAGITMVKPKRKATIRKSDELALELCAISKANPYKDAAGRFTTKAKAVSASVASAAVSRGRKSARSSRNTDSKTRYHGYLSAGRRDAVEAKAKSGSSVLLAPRDPSTGVAQVLSAKDARKRYGNTPEEIADSLKKLGVRKVVVDPAFAATEHAVDTMLGTAQVVEEASRMGITINKLDLEFVRKRSVVEPDGEYRTLIGRIENGNMIIANPSIDLVRSTSQEFMPALAGASPRMGNIRNAPYFAQIGGSPTLPPSEIARRYAYGVAVHEMGHHFTTSWAIESPFLKRVFNNYKIPTEYGTKHQAEMVAEGFTAWWLLGGSKAPAIANYYKKWMPIVTYTLDGEGNSVVLKAETISDITSIYVDKLAPNHPLIVWLTNGASLG